MNIGDRSLFPMIYNAVTFNRLQSFDKEITIFFLEKLASFVTELVYNEITEKVSVLPGRKTSRRRFRAIIRWTYRKYQRSDNDRRIVNNAYPWNCKMQYRKARERKQCLI